MEVNNSDLHHIVQIYTALGIGHIFVVVIPSVLFAVIVLSFMWKLMKEVGFKPVNLLFSLLAILCITGPVSYGILWDVSLITNIPFFGNCSNAHPVFVIQYVLFSWIHTIISFTISMISVVQYVSLSHKYGRFMTSKNVFAVFLILSVASIGICCIYFNGKYVEIRGSHCKLQEYTVGIIDLTVWLAFAFILPVVTTIMFTVLTCLKVRNEVIEENTSVVKSVVRVTVLNVLSYVVLRTIAAMLYYLGTGLDPSPYSIDVWTTVARYLADLNYTLTVLSILIIHSNIRNKILNMTLIVSVKVKRTDDKAEAQLNSS